MSMNQLVRGMWFRANKIRFQVLFVCMQFLVGWSVASAQQAPRVVSIGDFLVENGQSIHDCKIGFQTLGELNKGHSNVVVFLTWFTGTSKDILPLLGPGKLVDTSKYFVVIIDALGDGISSSPSNHALRNYHPRYGEFSTPIAFP
jgi:homoserine O-acetyltransferase/O-succinyltransferase